MNELRRFSTMALKAELERRKQENHAELRYGHLSVEQLNVELYRLQQLHLEGDYQGEEIELVEQQLQIKI